MKKTVFIVSLFFLFSCVEKEEIIQYSYEDATITRLNIENVAYFYYGKFNEKEELPNEYIRVSSFDGFIQGYLIFRESGLIEIVKTVGTFDKIGNESNLKITVFDHNVDYINWTDKIKANYNNIIEFSDIEKIELNRNKENNSNVVRTKISKKYVPIETEIQ